MLLENAAHASAQSAQSQWKWHLLRINACWKINHVTHAWQEEAAFLRLIMPSAGDSERGRHCSDRGRFAQSVQSYVSIFKRSLWGTWADFNCILEWIYLPHLKKEKNIKLSGHYTNKRVERELNLTSYYTSEDWWEMFLLRLHQLVILIYQLHFLCFPYYNL